MAEEGVAQAETAAGPADDGLARRAAAVVSIDVVGFSRLMEQDEAGTLAQLKAHRAATDPLAAAYGGRIVGVAGDGMLLEFPGAVHAVECMVAVQTEMARRTADAPEDQKMRYRVGVNLGDVIADGDDIFGDVVNVAARLQALAPPGGVALSAAVREEVARTLDLALEYVGEAAVKNIARKVAIWRWTPAGAPPAPTAQISERPALAVLAFRNLSGDEAEEYFSDGVTEDIITELSRYAGFDVIARHSSFVYKDRPADPMTVARELGAAYVVEGSVRRAGRRARLSVQLIDGQTGLNLWAERYDRDIEDIFAVQDEITVTIAASLGAKLAEGLLAGALARRPEDMTAYDLHLRAAALCLRLNRADNLQARALAEQAAARDPGFAGTQAVLAWTWLIEAVQHWTDDPASALVKGRAHARKAVEADPRAHAGFVALGFAEAQFGAHDAAIALLEKAIRLNPSDADGYAHLANALYLAGRPEKALAAIRNAIRLNPFHPGFYQHVHGRAQLVLGDDAGALAAFDAALAATPGLPGTLAGRAAALAGLGRRDEAREAVAALVGAAPGYSIAKARQSMPFRREEDWKRYEAALRAAGLPD